MHFKKNFEFIFSFLNELKMNSFLYVVYFVYLFVCRNHKYGRNPLLVRSFAIIIQTIHPPPVQSDYRV